MKYKEQDIEEYVGDWSKKCSDISGKLIGGWKVICRGPNSEPAGHSRFWCECECGSLELKYSTHLNRKLSSHCVNCANKKAREKRWKGKGDISIGYWNNVVSKAQDIKRKSRIGITFDINIDYAWKLFLKQDKCCALTGIPLQFSTTIKQRKEKQTASLDRIDGSKGYVKGNVQWVHKDINRMKNVYPEPYFIEMCKKVANKN